MRHVARPPLAAICAACATLLVRAVGEDKLDNVVRLNKYNFDHNVRHGSWFVKFYAPWCTHCQRLAPIWEKLADQAVASEWPVKIAEVDCTTNKEICEKVKVRSFPNLLLINNGQLLGKYQGDASNIKHFEDWLGNQQMLGSGQKVVSDDAATQPGAVTATHSAAISAVLHGLLTRFPTKSKVLNLYIYGGTLLLAVVAILLALAKSSDEPDPDEHEKAS